MSILEPKLIQRGRNITEQTELTLFSLCFLRKIKGTIKELKKYHKMCKDVFPRMTEEWALF